MSDREFTRAAILRRVASGEMTIKDAAPLLGVSYRQAKRLTARFRSGGRKALVHGNAGRRSNRANPDAHREQVLALVRRHYGGTARRGPGQRFGPTLAAEHLWTDHGVLVPVTTLTRWMQGAELWGRLRRSKSRHVRRERKAHFGELLQLDGSFHDWFEGRGPRACVMTMVDDATGHTLLRFGSEETIWAAAGILQAWIAKHGVPHAIYADWKNVYQRAPTLNEQVRGETPLTHFGRICSKLGITLIGAASPQAKGRVERGHGTHQDRLIKKLRLQRISDVLAANAYMPTYLAAHNARFAVPAASAADYHRPRDPRRLDADIFCLESARTIGNDHVVQYKHQSLQLDRRIRSRIPIKSRVVVRETEDAALRVVHIASDGRERLLDWCLTVSRAPKPKPITRATTPEPITPPEPWRPAANHPWRVHPVVDNNPKWTKHRRPKQTKTDAPPATVS
jgi:transposase